MSNNTKYWDHSIFILDYHPILLTCSVVICITNCLVISLFLTQASLRSTANYLLFSLAISDLAVGLFGIPMNLMCEMLGGWNVCLSSYTVNRIIAISSVYHIFWITLEKYFAIIYPFWHKSHSNQKKIKNICLCTWLASVLLSVVQLSWLTQHDDSYAEYTKDIERKEIIYNSFIFAGVVVFPIVVMAFAYTSIFLRILRQHSNEFLRKHTNGKERSLHSRIPQNVKTALLFFAILLVFILGWFWWFFDILYFNILHNKQLWVPIPVHKFLTVLRYSTSFVNPILYTFFKRDFQKALRKLANRSRLAPVEQQQSRLTPAVNNKYY